MMHGTFRDCWWAHSGSIGTYTLIWRIMLNKVLIAKVYKRTKRKKGHEYAHGSPNKGEIYNMSAL